MARWVYDNLHGGSSGAASCATGNSGGAMQVSFLLSHYGLEEILSAVVPTGGPRLWQRKHASYWIPLERSPILQMVGGRNPHFPPTPDRGCLYRLLRSKL